MYCLHSKFDIIIKRKFKCAGLSGEGLPVGGSFLLHKKSAPLLYFEYAVAELMCYNIYSNQLA